MFHFDKNFGLFVGKLTDNIFHKHYALQLTVAGISTIEFSVKNQSTVSGNSIFINSNVEHKLISQSIQLTILINPLSSIGHQLYLVNKKTDFSILNNELSENLIVILNQFESNKLTFQELCEMTSEILFNYQCTCESENHFQDDRFIEAIKYMDDNFEKVLSLEEVSAKCFLSSTRFLHLFKERTNLTFRRYQLWNKIVKSLPYLTKNSITDTAYTFGFSDSSHYTRTFKETFGVTPKFLFLKE